MRTFAKRHALVLFVYFMVILLLLTYFMDPFMSCATLLLFLFAGIKSVKYTWGLCGGMMIMAALINGLFNHRGVTTLFYLGEWRITQEACLYGLWMAIFLGAVYFTFSWMNRLMTGDKWMSLFGGLSTKLALLFSMTLGMIPKLQGDYRMIRQCHRGIGKKKHSVQMVGALIGNALEDSIDRSDSMKARGYYANQRKTSLLPKIGVADVIWLLCILLIAGGCFLIGIQGKIRPEFFPEIQMWKDGVPMAEYVLYSILLMLPWLAQIKEEIQWKRYLKLKE